MAERRFAGRVALVTGASGGLGGVVVRAFLAEGARVAAVARDALALAGLREVAGDDARLLTVAAALTEPGEAARAVRAVRDWAGGLDVLVNTVGGFSGGRPLAESTPDEWRRMLDGNLLAVAEAMRAALPAMLERGGRIVNVSSRAAQRIGPNVAAYTAAKAGLEALTLATAEEYRERRITVNAVAPSAIATPAMLQGATARQRERWVTPESIAGVILFLASDAAADVSGAIIPVYGRA